MKQTLIWACFAIGVIVFASGFFVASPIATSAKRMVVATGLSVQDLLGLEIEATALRTRQRKVTLDIDITSPPNVRAGDTFLVGMNTTVARIEVLNPEDVKRSGRRYEDSMDDVLRSADITYQLLIAGVEVKPADPVTLSNDGRAWWSVKAPDQAHSLPCVIRPSKMNFRYQNRPYSIEPIPDEALVFTVDVRKPLFTTSTLLSWGAKFLGPLLTLPGLLAFLDRWRDQKRKRAAESEHKPRIITDV